MNRGEMRKGKIDEMNMHSIQEHVAGLEAEILMRDVKIQKHEVFDGLDHCIFDRRVTLRN